MDGRALLAIALAVLLALSGCVTTLQDPADDASVDADTTEWTVEVVSVVDGDTLKVRFPDGNVENVRLLGVDTPEVHTEVSPDEFEDVPDTDRGREWLRDWGQEASEWMRQRVADAEVTIATDPTADRRGGYGRLLVYVSIDGDDVNAELLEQGYARLYDTEFQQRDRYASLEATARTRNAGLWGYTDGSSTATDDGLSWDASNPIWDNDADVVYVETATGTVVVEYGY